MRNAIKQRLPRAYELVVSALGTAEVGLRQGGVIKAVFGGSTAARVIVNLGSGTSAMRGGVFNVDVARYANVHVVADAAALPFRTETLDLVVAVSLLEHVRDMERVIEEIERCLNTDGWIYVAMPFLYPFHGAPSDYRRLTLAGLRRELRGFESMREGVDGGPVTALLIQSSYAVALVCSLGMAAPYGFFVNTLIILTSPLRILDQLVGRIPRAHEVAASLYFLGRKRRR